MLGINITIAPPKTHRADETVNEPANPRPHSEDLVPVHSPSPGNATVLTPASDIHPDASPQDSSPSSATVNAHVLANAALPSLESTVVHEVVLVPASEMKPVGIGAAAATSSPTSPSRDDKHLHQEAFAATAQAQKTLAASQSKSTQVNDMINSTNAQLNRLTPFTTDFCAAFPGAIGTLEGFLRLGSLLSEVNYIESLALVSIAD
ncbi:hypothetical protein DL93DRAFT_1350944 [Clavulina sp. PMI_390]|nr:hypothetical protein DL93DRAFT_1350944 [Clavulina sp. PMI_390]